jgi:hypothetical protein
MYNRMSMVLIPLPPLDGATVYSYDNNVVRPFPNIRHRVLHVTYTLYNNIHIMPVSVLSPIHSPPPYRTVRTIVVVRTAHTILRAHTCECC